MSVKTSLDSVNTSLDERDLCLALHPSETPVAEGQFQRAYSCCVSSVGGHKWQTPLQDVSLGPRSRSWKASWTSLGVLTLESTTFLSALSMIPLWRGCVSWRAMFPSRLETEDLQRVACHKHTLYTATAKTPVPLQSVLLLLLLPDPDMAVGRIVRPLKDAVHRRLDSAGHPNHANALM